MTAARAANVPAKARWDGRRILFEVEHEGDLLPCAISPDALRDLSSERCFRPAELLRCFAAERVSIEAIVRGKLRAHPSGVPGLLNIWSGDVEDVPRPAPEAPGAA